MQNLGDLLEKNHDGSGNSKGLEGISRVSGSDNINIKSETKAKQSCLQKEVEHGSEDKNDIGNHGEEGHILLNMTEHGHGSLASLEKWYNSDSGGMLDQLCSSSYWFNSLT